ncbi:hypothetical protein L226DRAFT_536881 [Lentinus tigrinus ALCF2SS1-7]|uniref:uncharacterized protein n=1 Tax=Lentinus tigrinus ALCF2SS1-7 TaxID=1328758 RepID=UPI0011661FCE|nr:hypothetical protein L226DRAFT_536881 [Lentinus tigrinus ALCF2SS1-7]
MTASLATVSCGSGADGASSKLPNASSLEQYQSSRRSAMDVFADKRPDPSTPFSGAGIESDLRFPGALESLGQPWSSDTTR